MSKANPGLEGGHILVDLDGTLAQYSSGDHSRYGAGHVGEPIPAMLARVKRWLEEGRDVRIFTARNYTGTSAKLLMESHLALLAIGNWCLLHLGTTLPVTNKKGKNTDIIFDDIAVTVVSNIGPVPYLTPLSL